MKNTRKSSMSDVSDYEQNECIEIMVKRSVKKLEALKRNLGKENIFC